MEEEEDGRRVGRRDDGAEQQPLDPREAEENLGGERHQHGGEDDPGRRQDERRRRGDAKRRDARLEAGIEEDDGERDGADEDRRRGHC